TVQAQREQAARIAGELQAAQRIQNGTLPRPDLLQGERRIDLHAALTPAREVGGDLYDFFMLDADRLFVLVGDVAGKGLSASIFMAVSKALYKGSVLRAPRADIGELMRRANAEVSRDNGEMLFVTAFAAVLDLRHGTLAYCNAGHDNPWLLAPDGGAPERLTDGDGPPLCAVPDWDYQGARRQLQPGSWLWLVTDGVPEARDPKGQAYGAARAERVLRQACGGGAGARDVVQALHDDVRAFTGGAEPHDDVTILALRWRGPAGG
ncbi:MAG: PP2C family protein-serine/threonine phosphatase, partial [Rubrivivax sp.]|nr:PP2C family protein-serine/threonine phosphatase [Rubrivivax sp.]